MSQDSKNSDFGAIFAAYEAKVRTQFQIGDRLRGTVTHIDRNSIFVDVGSRSDAILDRTELQDAEGKVPVKVGDALEAFCIGTGDDTIRLTTRMNGSVADASLLEAYEAGIPVEGRVGLERKGGYEVEVAGQKGFCPYSQMDLFRREPATYIGEKFTFLITEYDSDGGNLVLSRRRCLEKEQEAQRQKLRETLVEGALVEGTVTRLMPFGAFVDLGAGVEGLVHVSELGWGRGLKPEEVLTAGQKVTVSVQKLDWENNRLSLSLRQTQESPWSRLEGGSDYVVGRRCEGVVTKLMPFGAFVELEPGLEGLVHISRLGAGRRIGHPSEVLQEGQTVEVTIVSIEPERQRLSLSMEDRRAAAVDDEPEAAAAAASADGQPAIRAGARLTGTVESHRDFGVFVNLAEGQTGLLHISQVEVERTGNPGKALYRRFPPNSSLEVVVLSVEGRRISLTLPETLEREAERQQVSDVTDQGGASLGNLGDVFGGLRLE